MKGSMKNNVILVGCTALVIGSSLGFVGGMQYQKTQTAQMNPGNSQFQGSRPNGQNGSGERLGGRMQGGGPNNGMMPTSGEIISVDDLTITIKSQDGNKIAIYSDSTTINKTSSGTISDLQAGEQAMVIGSVDANGTITAQTISIGGGFRGMPNEQPANAKPEEE